MYLYLAKKQTRLPLIMLFIGIAVVMYAKFKKHMNSMHVSHEQR